MRPSSAAQTPERGFLQEHRDSFHKWGGICESEDFSLDKSDPMCYYSHRSVSTKRFDDIPFNFLFRFSYLK